MKAKSCPGANPAIRTLRSLRSLSGIVALADLGAWFAEFVEGFRWHCCIDRLGAGRSVLE